ncbi:MAG: Membrane sensor protein UhpC [Chlamydiia bacterium]|nr:Membrane sensor protein UhpC [Chlamydiia bacterium]
MSLFSFFKPAPYKKVVSDPELVKKRYKYWRIRIFYSMYSGYAFYYLTRKSFTFAMPAMMVDLGLTKSQLGLLGSVLYLSYGLSKFVSGVMSDRSNPRYFMAFGLILTGIVNIAFGFSSSLIAFAVFWGINGWFQGFGWPPCARLLTHWYSQSERGRWWSFWSTSHNVGGVIIPILAAFLAQSWGWRSAMYVPGGLCIMGGLFLINRLRDTPQSLGLPSIEEFRSDYPGSSDDEIEQSRAEAQQERELTTKEILFQYVLKNPAVWILSISYFFVYVIRTAVNDWGQLYLFEQKGFTLMAAGSCIVLFEVGGFVGSLAAGWISDTVFNGKRGPVNVIFCIASFLVIGMLWFLPVGAVLAAWVSMFLIGFFIFGPQMLIGVTAAELSHKKAAGTATGFAGWFAYFGAAAAGFPCGKVAQDFGWGAFFFIMAACAAIATVILFPLWSASARPKVFQKKSANA